MHDVSCGRVWVINRQALLNSKHCPHMHWLLRRIGPFIPLPAKQQFADPLNRCGLAKKEFATAADFVAFIQIDPIDVHKLGKNA